MDVNVCSRRVHDGYATIRSRGRPRAVYRSDSEELLKEAGGPYALPRLSNFRVVPEDARQVPRWADLGQDQPLIENYGTLRAIKSRDFEEPRKVTLKTFSRRDRHGSNSRNSAPQGNLQRLRENNDKNCEITQKKDHQADTNFCGHYGWKPEDCACYGCNDRRIYDTVPVEDNTTILKPCVVGTTSQENSFININNNRHDVFRNSKEDVENFNNRSVKDSRNNCILKNKDNPYVEMENDKRKSAKDLENIKNDLLKNSKSTSVFNNDLEKRRFSKDQHPIYAVPQVFSKPRRERRLIVIDGNYVPSGDLYRTTAKYIEDINRNLAEIDKSYEVMKASPRTYGVINRIAKGELLPQDQSGNLFGYVRKRNMAPMLPISADIEEVVEETNEKEFRKDTKYFRRPNSKGRLPPKVLPRSSSIENTSRHSTGSTTASSSKSTESLYAISESLTELPKICDFQKQNSPSNKISQELVLKKSNSQNQSKFNIDKDIPKRSKSAGLEIKDSSSSTDDEISIQKDRLPVTSAIRRNRSRVDQEKSLLRKERASNEVLETSLLGKLEHVRSMENRLKDRRYDTLPSRRPRISSRPLHKSSEDVLDGERFSHDDSDLQKSCSNDNDVNRKQIADENLAEAQQGCFYIVDATDVILKGQLERSNRLQRQDLFPRTRHNSLESKEADAKVQASAFATLPRRGNLAKDQPDSLRRFSGNGPTLEPLYEHAVSDPVKPREIQNVIPWWELATRKYRHRSCPSLQAHVVSAFEQSLSNMTQRLQQLTATAEKKDSELQELRETIERLRKQSAEAGLNNGPTANNGRRHTLGDSESGTTGCTGNSSNNHHQGASMARQLSADSVTSLNSLSSACSASSNHHKKKGWLRSSFSKAFSRSRKNRHGSVSDAEDCKESPGGDLSAPNSPRLPTASKHESLRTQTARSNGQKSPDHENPLSGSKSSSALYKKDDEDVDELKKQLREKDLVLTDIRLEALSSAHQLESLKDTVIKMRYEMLNLKQNNERLQRLVTSKSLTSSQSSLPSDPDRRFSMTEVASSVAALSNGDISSTADQLEDLNVPIEHSVVPSSATTEPVLEQDTDGKRINVAVYLGSERNFNYNLITGSSADGTIGEPPHCVIANVCISNKTSWDALDSIVRRCFKEYVSRVDPVTNLGLGVECVAAYHLGEASRCTTDSQHPELLPCGYLVGHVKTIYLVLSGYSWLAVDTLIPRSIVQRLISLLTEHRRVILCGPSGTGKSYLAGKLAHALVDADSDTKDAAAVATFNVDHKSSKELRQYLAHIAERCDSNAADELPRVIILENLQHAASLGELFSGLLGTRHSSCPAIIGTMSQATCSTTNLQLHHNFRWVLCANHMEPVKGFLGRYLRRKLLEHELRECAGTRNAEMAAVVEWLPRVWLHLNKFLETHSSSDVTIGPRLFLSCPMEVAGSQVWFTDLWNYSVIPYLVEAVREGLTLYGRRVSGNGNGEPTWEDPAQFITSSYPWLSTHAVHGGSDALLRLRPEDVGYDVVSSGHTSGVGASSVKSLGSTHSDTEGDPLLNMLMRLQEAANYSSPHSNDSDSVTSLDSSHTRHSEDLSSSTSSSRGVESAL
ncbi:PREDICTED: uncharacterized protein LOC105454090 [Wasmannia auropunctata]|uniref:uncharacterized protein LOC105454090 n=1 Tax=Wasmannia auropunctata TaxID=64793 RepID=UPI0005F01FB9|nr:PREDICTED: uncharacterized protein LOC105454090 [Wasmannia auropunctata]